MKQKITKIGGKIKKTTYFRPSIHVGFLEIPCVTPVFVVEKEAMVSFCLGRMSQINKISKAGEVLKSTHALREAEQRKYDGVILDVFEQKTIKQLRRNPTVIDKLKTF